MRCCALKRSRETPRELRSGLYALYLRHACLPAYDELSETDMSGVSTEVMGATAVTAPPSPQEKGMLYDCGQQSRT